MRTQIIDKSVVVSAIEGNVEIVLADGSSRPLQKGEILQPGAKLTIADDAKLALSPYDDTPAQNSSTGSESVEPGQPQGASPTEGAPSDIAALQQSILQGVDPTQNFEASAAGGAPAAGGGGGIGGVAGASGNGGFVTIDRTGDATIAAAGFDTTYDTAAVINENQAEDLILENQLDDLGEAVVTLEDTQVSGNLLENSTNPDGPADASIVSYDWGINIGVPAGVAATITGVGTLIINPDGSYTFTPAPNYDGAVPPVNYQVTDGQDTVTSTLVISITPVDEEVGLGGLALEGGEVLVSDANLADGSTPDTTALTQGGAFTFNAPDGVQTLVVGAIQLISNGTVVALPLSIETPLGNVLQITAITYDPVTGNGSVSYSYTLLDNETHQQPAFDLQLGESLTVTLTDDDGDTTSATLDIVIQDDVPTQSVSVAEEANVGGLSVSLDETVGEGDTYNGSDVDDGYVSDDVTDALAQATTAIEGGLQSLFTSSGSYGADGEGSTTGSFSFVGIGEAGVATNLSATDGGAITLNAVSATELQGIDSDGNVVFSIKIVVVDGVSQLQTTQFEALSHGNIDLFDESLPLLLSGQNSLGLQYSVTRVDGDGDRVTDSATVSLVAGERSVFSFDDDGPSSSVQAEASLKAAVVDESLATLGGAQGDGVAQSYLDASSIEGLFNYTYGADGAGSRVFSLELAGRDVGSGLFALGSDGAKGSEIVLNQGLDGVVTGSVGSVNYFTLAMDGDGKVTFTLLDNVWHSNTGSNDDASTLNVAAGQLNIVQTVTDGDLDSVQSRFDVGSSGVFKVEDDGPKASNVEAPLVLDDEGLAGGINGGPSDVAGANTVTSGNLGYQAGADGLKSLELSGPISLGTESVTSTWDAQSGTLSISSTRGVLMTVTITDPSTGAYSVKLLQPLMHSEVDSEDNITLNVGYKVTDGDGDSATGSLAVTINDDTPTIQVGELDLNSSVTFLGSNAGYSNSYGYYIKGDDGTPVSGQVIWANVHNQSSGNQVDISALDPAHTGFFVIPNGGANPSLGNNTVVTFQLVDGKWQAFMGSTPLSGADGANIVFSDASLNPGGSHLQDTGSAGNQNWEDMTANSDYDYNDVSTSVTWGGAVQLQVDESNLNHDVIADFSGVFNVQPGADGLGSQNYSLNIQNVNSGLIDTATGEQIRLVMNDSTIEGRTATTGELVFSLTVDGSGKVTLDQLRAVEHPTSDPDEATFLGSGHVSLTLTVTDKDGDHASGVLDIGKVISFKDDGPSISAGNAASDSLQVDESNLSLNASANYAGLFTSSFGADGAGTLVYSLNVSAAGADSGLNDTATGQDILLYLESGSVVGRVGGSSGSVAFTLTVNSSGEVALDQVRAIAHTPNSGPDQESSLLSANLVKLVGTITDKDGDSQSASVDLGSAISFKDDGPSVTAATNSGQATQVQNTNLMLILDVSGSMGDPSGYQGMTRMEVMQKSALELLDKYSAYGTVMVNIITFASSANNPTSVWVNVDVAKSTILGLVPSGSTNYDDALNEAIKAFGDSGRLTGAQNVSYFMSDGLPNANSLSGSAATVPDGSNSLGGGDGIDGDGATLSGETKDWADFLTANNINSFALGMGSGATQSALDPIAYNGVSGASPANTTAVVVTDFSQLAATLLSTVVAPPLSGQLIDGITASSGADGGWLSTITVGGVTYTYNQKTDTSGVSGGTSAGTFNTTTNEWSITVAGGILKVDMDNGVYTYTPPSSIPAGGINQSIGYSVIDNDGDTASSTLSITIKQAVGPTVVRDDFIITNQDPATIPDWALLANDTGPLAATQVITGVSGAVGGTVTDGAGSIVFDDTSGSATPSTYDGSFNYTNSTTTDPAKVFVDVQSGSTLTGSYLDEILIGGSGNDTLNGNAGNDILLGGAGNDSLNGGEGNDILVGGAGNDTLNGGSGNDTASYLDSTAGVTVTVNGNNQITGGAGTDSLSNMENLIGSMFNDSLTGDGNANVLSGLAGNDILIGGGGDDMLIGGAGSDTMTGGSGKDTFKWSAADAGGTDVIKDFTTGTGGDVLDISELLTGEHADKTSLDAYLTFTSGPGTGKSTLTIDLDGSGSGSTTHVIQFDSIDLTLGGSRSDQTIIEDLLNQGNLKVDP